MSVNTNKKFVDEVGSNCLMLNASPSVIERDRNNDIFDRLLKFGTESDRPTFCQRLQIIWDEQGIFCQSYPTITNQILDFYKLHRLVQEKQGYLEITTNRGWKEISNVLGFGDSGSAAYSVKRNYVRLGLLAYECRFDRAGIDPRAVIELSEMPHTVKKRKRGNNYQTSTARTNVKTNKQQPQILPTQHEHDEMKNPPIDNQKYVPYAQNPFRLMPQQISIHNLHIFPLILRAGYLADSNKHLDALLVWLSDQRTAPYFNLKYLPGLFHSIIEQYIGRSFTRSIEPPLFSFYLACLYELFGQSFLQSSSTNDYYTNWFLQSNFRINESTTGPYSDPQYLESLFYGSYRYILKRLITSDENDQQQHTDRDHSIMIRCSCLATIVRNLSFIDENEFLANDRCLLDILERILNCSHQEMHDIFDEEPQFESFLQMFTRASVDLRTDRSFSCINDCNQHHLMSLLDNTFITLSNLSTFIDLRYCHFGTRSRLINTIMHWISCSLSFANESFISMVMEDRTRKEEIFISPRQISLQIFAKLCTNELNVDLIFLNLDFSQLKFFSHTLLSIMKSSNPEDVAREYCLMIICSLCKRHQQLVKYFASQLICIELIFNYLEFYEYNQQQYLIATLTSCYQPTSTPPINWSSDMMIDSCIQLLGLFAPIEEKNCLKLFEYRLLDMSSSIYFEQRILKAFADILFIIKS